MLFITPNKRMRKVCVQKTATFFSFVFNCSRASSRHCYETCEIGGYTIPAGVRIQMNLEAVHMNKDLWGPEDPRKLVPER